MYNKAIVIGRLAADPELKTTPNGVSVCSFRIAVDRAYTKGDNKQTDWLEIVTWQARAEFVAKFFTKGKPILVEGSIQSRNYTDKNDQKRTAIEIVADNVRFVGNKSDGDKAYSGPANEGYAEVENDGDLPWD